MKTTAIILSLLAAAAGVNAQGGAGLLAGQPACAVSLPMRCPPPPPRHPYSFPKTKTNLRWANRHPASPPPSPPPAAPSPTSPANAARQKPSSRPPPSRASRRRAPTSPTRRTWTAFSSWMLRRLLLLRSQQPLRLALRRRRLQRHHLWAGAGRVTTAR